MSRTPAQSRPPGRDELADPLPPENGGTDAHDDPRLDTTAWRIFGLRLPRRWTVYFRVFAALLLALAMLWWFTRDVTYVDNVKVAGIDAVPPAQEEPLREVATELAAMVNWLADRGYAWQSGGLPSLRAGDALTEEEAARLVAVGTAEVGGGSSLDQEEGQQEFAAFLEERGWRLSESAETGADAAVFRADPLEALLEVGSADPGRERLTLSVVE